MGYVPEHIIADAKTLATTLLNNARASTIDFLGSIAGDIEKKVPTIETDAEKYALSFIPEPFQAIVAGFADQAVAALEPESVALLKTWWGQALIRIEAAIPTQL